MKLKDRLYYNISRIYPDKYRTTIKNLYYYAGYRNRYDFWLGMVGFFSILVALIVYIFPVATGYGDSRYFVIYGIIMFFVINFIYYYILIFKSEKRKVFIEKVLTDFLQLLSSNLRAGLSPYKALKNARRKEFGILDEELEIVIKKSLGNDSFTKLMMRLCKITNSIIFTKSIKLFLTSVEAGGKSADVLELLSKDIVETKQLKRELISSTKTYSMFILFTIVIGAPLLLAISIKFLGVVDGISGNLVSNISSDFNLGNLGGTISIGKEFLFKISIVFLSITGLLASIMLGVVKEGNFNEGIKYSPFVIFVTLVVFMISNKFINGIII